MLNTATMNIDRSEFEPIPWVRRATPGCAINVSRRGQVTLNARLIENIKARTDSFSFGFAWHKQDKRILLLYLTDTPNYSFPDSGSRKDKAFSQALVADGIPLPARFAFSWNEGAACWVGLFAAIVWRML
jgi:hypothetical protein